MSEDFDILCKISSIKNKYVKNIYHNTLFYTIFLNYVNDIDKIEIEKKKTKRGAKKKYTDNLFFLEVFLYIIETGISYRKLQFKCSYSTIIRKFKFWAKNNVFHNVYILLIQFYIKHQYINYKNIHNLLIDCTNIKNINGCDFIGPNHYDRFFNGTKLSIITTNNNIPISVVYSGSNTHDISLLLKTIDNSLIKIENSKIAGDKGYHSDSLKKELKKERNINLIFIPKNKRRTKEEIINKTPKKKTENHFTKLEKTLIDKRYKIENFFSTLKLNQKIRLRNEKKIKNYMNYLYLSFSKYLTNMYKDNNIMISYKEYNKLKNKYIK